MTTEPRNSPPRTVNASDFEARCLSLIDEVAETGESIIITKDGRPVSRLVPCSDGEPNRNGPPFPSPLGASRGVLVIHDHDALLEPLDNDWEQASDEQWEEWS